MSLSSEKRAAIAKRLAELCDPETGRITPEAVVADARKKSSPLHSEFEWDLKKAAYKHWIEHARKLITLHVEVKTIHSQISVVGYVRDPRAKQSEPGYLSVEKVSTDEELAREVLVQEFARVRDLLNRVRELAKAFELSHELDLMISQVAGLRDRVMNMPEQRM